MLAFQAFHLAAYRFAHGTFQPIATGSAPGCSELDSLLGGAPDPVDLNAALDVCFDPQFSCSHAKAKKNASSLRALILIGVAAFCAFTPHTTKPSVLASKLAEANHPVACPPQWLPVLLAANTPGLPTNHRRLLGVFTTKAELKTAVGEYDANVAAAEKKYGPIADWDVSGITDMSRLFDSLSGFNTDISSWPTSGVRDMSGMFYAATAFNQPLSFDTSSVTDINSMFLGASAFNQLLSFDTFSVTDMNSMFYKLAAFNQPLRLDTSGVTDMSDMFRGATAFNQPLSLDTSSVRDMSSMFDYATAFNQPLSFDTSSVRDMSEMFLVRFWLRLLPTHPG